MSDTVPYDPPRTDRYEHVWQIIDANHGSENVVSTDCIKLHMERTYRRTKITTRNKYLVELRKFDRILKERGHDPLPWRIDEPVVLDLLNEAWRDREVSTKKWYTHILDRYLQFYGNRVVEELHLQWPHDLRPNVKWLSEKEYEKLMKIEKSPLEELVINLELGMGFRSVEVCRLRVCDVHYDEVIPFINIRGKGRGEGKWRSVPFGYDTERVLKRWMEERRKIVERMRMYNPYWKEPEELAIWCHYVDSPVAGPYSEQGHSIDRGPIYKLRERLGFDFTQHTLRRSYGRRLYHAGVKIETISKLLGHDDVRTTYKYLGINMDDMNDAMKILRDFDKGRLS